MMAQGSEGKWAPGSSVDGAAVSDVTLAEMRAATALLADRSHPGSDDHSIAVVPSYVPISRRATYSCATCRDPNCPTGHQVWSTTHPVGANTPQESLEPCRVV